MSQIMYSCELQGQDLGGNPFMHLNKPTKVYPVALGPIEDLPAGKSYSLFCDFTGQEFLINDLNNVLVQIWILYTYDRHRTKEGFQFLAQRRYEDKTYIWLPRGEGHEITPE